MGKSSVSLSSAQSDAFGSQPEQVSWSSSVVKKKKKKSQWLIKELKLAAVSTVSKQKKRVNHLLCWQRCFVRTDSVVLCGPKRLQCRRFFSRSTSHVIFAVIGHSAHSVAVWI